MISDAQLWVLRMVDVKSIVRDEQTSSLIVVDEIEYTAAMRAKRARMQQLEESINNRNRLEALESSMEELKGDISLIKELLLKGLK